MQTISEAKQFLRDNYDEGVDCPCCTQYVKRYKRTITSAMAYGLILIDKYFRKNPEKRWVHVEDYLKKLPGVPSSIRGDFSKLRFFGLVEKAEGKRDDGSPRNGLYRITELGKMFVMGQASVKKHVYIFNNKQRGFSDERTTITEALGKRFNYTDLMEGNL